MVRDRFYNSLSAPGVTPEYVHTEVVGSLSRLIEKAQTAAQLKSGSEIMERAVNVLEECKLSIESALETPRHNVQP